MANANLKRPSNEKVVKDWARYGRSVGKKYSIHEDLPSGVSPEDIEGMAMLGLMRAADSYNSGRGVPFKTHIFYQVTRTITSGLKKFDPLWGRKPRTKKYDPADQEQKTEQDNLQKRTEQYIPQIVSLDRKIGEDAYLIETIPFEEREPAISKDRLAEILKNLPEREIKFIEHHYFEGKNLAETGKIFGCTRSWASQYNKQIKEDLKKILIEKGITHP